MNRGRFIKSSYVLAAVAVAWIGGNVLLHYAYVQPNLTRQSQRLQLQTTSGWLRLANHTLREMRTQAQRMTGYVAADERLRQYVLTRGNEDIGAQIPNLGRSGISTLLVSDANGRLISAWKSAPNGWQADSTLAKGSSLEQMMLLRVSPGLDEASGLGAMPTGLAMFARSAVRQDDAVIGQVIALRPIDEMLMAEISSAVGITISLQPRLPSDVEVSATGQCCWREGSRLGGAQVFRDSFGTPMGYLVAEGQAMQMQQQARTIEQAVGTTMLWAVGFAVLMVLAIHVMVSAPTARLLERIERVQSSGEITPLSAGLRGEARALGRRFEEVLHHVEKLSETDALTGLANRRSFQAIFVREFRRSRRYGRSLSLAILDIDYFKAANDALGHQTGDLMLQVFARVIADNVRTADFISRLGGDEFAILMPETAVGEAALVSDRIRVCLSEKSIGRGELRMSPTASIGVVDLNSAGADTPEAMFDLADQALYAAKHAGRNRVVQAEEMAQIAAGQVHDQGQVDHLCKQLAGLDAKFKRLFVDAISGLISALEARDEHTANHSNKVRRYAVAIATQIGLSESACDHLGRAAVLHDIGKIGLPDSVLLKEGELTDEQWQMVRQHPVMGVRIMEGMEFLDQEVPLVRYHHERYDGAGYPEGLCGSAIPLGARILAVADAFDAMTSSRKYRGGMSLEKALGELRHGSGTQFDPVVVESFLKVVEQGLLEEHAPAATRA